MKEIENDIINPALMLAISRMKEQKSIDAQNKMIDEALKANFLVPCMIQVKPGTENETHRTTANTIPIINTIMTTDKKMYFMVFTDIGELKKWKDNARQNVLVMTFDKIAGLVLSSKSNAEGFVINPNTSNVVFQRDMIAGILAKREKDLKEEEHGGGE